MKVNQQLTNIVGSYLYNFDLLVTEKWLEGFHGIKYVCMQGSPDRARAFAKKVANKFLNVDERFFEPINLAQVAAFHCYRVGEVLSVSHGMGNPSIITLLHNISRIMYCANNFDVEYIRIGTSGGIGLDPGSVVLTKEAYMPNLIAGFRQFPLGREITYPTQMDEALNARIMAAQPKEINFKVLLGNSIAADDFYLGQARFDGAIKPRYNEQQRQDYFRRIQELNILNFEMESTALAAFCNRAEIPATMVAVTLLNRMLGDQITATQDILAGYADRAQTVLLNYLQRQIKP